MSDLFALKSHIDPVLDFYGAETFITERGIEVKSVAGDAEMFQSALRNAVSSFDDYSAK